MPNDASPYDSKDNRDWLMIKNYYFMSLNVRDMLMY
jgi:hypothetical protein